MFNMIKMDLYRMFRSKSLYIIGIIFVAIIFSTSAMVKFMTQDEKMSQMIEQAQSSTEDKQNVGMSISINPTSDGKVSVLDDLYGNVSGKAIALFLVIFTVIYASADYTSGYIKNIAGQVRNRAMLIGSKAVCLFIYTVMFFIVYVGIQTLSDTLILGYFKFGNVSRFFTYLGVELLLHYAMVLLVMTITVIIRNNLISMIISVCLCMNVFTLIYNAVDKLIEKIGVKDFSVFEYTLTGNITSMLPAANTDDIVRCVVVSIIFGVLFVAAGSIVFKKRDVV